MEKVDGYFYRTYKDNKIVDEVIDTGDILSELKKEKQQLLMQISALRTTLETVQTNFARGSEWHRYIRQTLIDSKNIKKETDNETY